MVSSVSTRLVAYQSPPTDQFPTQSPTFTKSSVNGTRVGLPKQSPVSVHQSYLPEAYHSTHSVSSTHNQTAEPLVSYSLRSGAVNSPSSAGRSQNIIGLHMQPSTLDPSFYAVSMDQNLTKPTAVKSRTLSPVAIQQSYLPQSYHAPLPAKSYSPSVPYSQRTCTNALGLLDDRDQTLIGLTTQSATLDATFYGQSPDGTRLKDANDDKGHIPRDSISSAYLDQTSQLSGSMSSKVDSNGVTSLRLTDDEWTSNPSSPDRLPSADLMDRIIKSPTDNTIKDAVIESQFTSYQSERTYEAPESSSHGFIQHDPKIQVVPLAQASDLTPSIACFHGMVSSQTSPSMTDTTPRAASQRVLDTAAQPDSEWRSLKEMDHIDMALEPDSP